MKTASLSHRIIISFIRRYPLALQKRFIEHLLRELGVPKSTACAAASKIRSIE